MWAAFAAFCRQHHLLLATVRSLRMWTEHMMGSLAPATINRYVSHVTAMNTRIFGAPVGTEVTLLADLRAAVSRAEAGRKRRQALPATAEDVRAMWKHAVPDVALAAALMWAGAMRFGDLVSVGKADVTLCGGGEVEIELRRTKTNSYGGPPRVIAIVVPRRVERTLESRLKTRAGPLVDTTYPHFLREMQRIHPHLSAHSLRRGAVQAAMNRGANDRAVMRLTGHTSLESLATYAGRLPTTWKLEMLSASQATMW